MTNKRKIAPYIPIIIALALILGIFIGNSISKKNNQGKPYLVYSQKDKLSKVLHLILTSYVDSVSKERLTEGAIHAMLDSLDPHSVYIPAQKLKRINEPLEGEFSGIGIQFNMIEDTVRVIKTIANGPSEKVGLIPGDKIVKVNDTIIAGVNMSTNEIVSKLKGKTGTKVNVSISRKGVDELIEYEITRDRIPLHSIDVTYMINDSIGYIKLSSFSKKTQQEIDEAVDKLENQGMKEIILDLRGNGGGYLGAAITTSDLFLKDGQLIVYTQGEYSSRRNYYATKQGHLENKKTVILIDEFSASASEIVAGALQDNDRATIVGRRSFGKGLVQQQIRLDDNSAIRLTVARYYTPTGRCIQKPYNNGKKDYYSELNRRYKNGEFFNTDSIHFSDSLTYTTPQGDTVYGGGGIMPDIFVPKDTVGITDSYSKIAGKGHFYKFAYKYADKHRKEYGINTNYKELEKSIKNKELLNDFQAYLKAQGMKLNSSDMARSKEIILTKLKANIARNLIGNQGYYPIISHIDSTLIKGIDVLQEKRP
jgi:carboxyl-terminal processing protease